MRTARQYRRERRLLAPWLKWRRGWHLMWIIGTVMFPVPLLIAAVEAAQNQTELPLLHEAYVWQRAWSESVRQAVSAGSTNFSCLVPLAAEVGWERNAPRVARVPLDYELLANIASRPGPNPCHIGVALRIGAYPGPFSPTNAAGQFVLGTARNMLAEARARKVVVREVHIDFDCAASKLAGYRLWVEAIRREAAPAKVLVTALPSWLSQPGFWELASASDGFVLQVHSLERPKDVKERLTLCDPEAAKRAVDRAGRLGVPFRVALPTYGYLVGFDSAGRFVAVSAEGSSRNWPAGTQVREVVADPRAMAGLVQHWSTNRPHAMQGIIWYRLPVPGDILNWRWPTLGAIIKARSPRESLRVESCRVEPGLTEVSLVNDGELDISSRLAIEARWQNARMVAADALRGFEMVGAGSSAVMFTNQPSRTGRLPAGEKAVVGWLRLSEDREVRVELKK